MEKSGVPYKASLNANLIYDFSGLKNENSSHKNGCLGTA